MQSSPSGAVSSAENSRIARRARLHFKVVKSRTRSRAHG
jgi:hypothetical protein